MSSDLRSGSDWPSVGMKCICVSAEDCSIVLPGPKIYVVEAVLMYGGVQHINVDGNIEYAHRFRPIVDEHEESDIKLFRSLLNTLPAEGAIDELEEATDYAGLMLDASWAYGLAAISAADGCTTRGKK